MAKQKTTATKIPAKKRAIKAKAPTRKRTAAKTATPKRKESKVRKQPNLSIQRVFLKKLLFESPQSPQALPRESKPSISMHMRSHDTR